MHGTFACLWAPCMDGVELQEHPITLALRGSVHPTAAIMHGVNRDESVIFMQGVSQSLDLKGLTDYLAYAYGAGNTAAIQALYSGQTFPSYKTFTESFWVALPSLGDFSFSCTAQLLSQALGTARRPVYNYFFT